MAKAKKKAAAAKVAGNRVNAAHQPWANEQPGLDGYYKSEAIATIDSGWGVIKKLKQALEAWRIRLATSNVPATDPGRMTYERLVGQVQGREGQFGAKNVQYRQLPHELNWLPYIKDAAADVAWFADAAKLAGAQSAVAAKQAAPKEEKPARSEGSTISTYEPPPAVPTVTAAPSPAIEAPAAPTEWTGPFGWSKGVTIGVGVGVGVLFLGGLSWALLGTGKKKPAPAAAPAIVPPGAPVMGLSLFEHKRKRRRSRK